MKYIDSEKLFAKIKIIQQSLESRDVRFNQVKKIRTECLIEFCKCITDVIDSLQKEQSEVDLEKEIKEEYLKLRCYGGRYNMLVILNERQFNKIVRHFFELGLKAQKGE